MEKVKSFINLYESLNQSAIAVDQQRDRKNLKYTPSQSKVSYMKGNIPTAYPEKVGIVATSRGISDEEKEKDLTEILIPGYGRLLAHQLERKIKEYVNEINQAYENKRYGSLPYLTGNLKHFAKTYNEYLEDGKHVWTGY
jgi:hypothetical protein